MDEAEQIGRGLSPHEVKAMNKLKRALNGFDPIAALPGISENMADRLVAYGLAEKGKATSSGGPFGYRLSDLGWRALEAREFPPPRT